MTHDYSSLLRFPILHVAEKAQAYNFLTERHIQALWMEQKYIYPLSTACGVPVQVLSPGIWNVEAGPDFRKAHLRIGEKEYFGDVEIHLNDESWEQHGHHLDSRYDNVVLHVSFWKPRKINPITTSIGNSAFQLYLESFLTVPPARLLRMIDLDLYPYRRFIGSGRCAHDLFKRMSEERVRAFFQQAADWRLQRKMQYLKSRVADPALYIPAGIAMALGYKSNAEAFLDLFLRLQQEQPADEISALSWLMKSTGFFSKRYLDKWGDSEFYRLLASQNTSQSPDINIVINQIRPLNHPVRRFAYLSRLIFDLQGKTFYQKLIAFWTEGWAGCLKSGRWKVLWNQIIDLIPTYLDPYWNSHYLFEKELKSHSLALIGKDLRSEIVINALLPILQDNLLERKTDASEWEAFRSFYNSIAASKTGKTKYLAHRFFGDAPKGNVLNKAYTEQGAYQLHYDFCVHFEASCEGCPFVERYNTTFG
jgi:hypothetical protein